MRVSYASGGDAVPDGQRTARLLRLGRAPVRGRLVVAVGTARLRWLRRLGTEAGLPPSLAEPALTGAARVREHRHGPWRYLAVPAAPPPSARRALRQEAEVLSVLAAPGWLVLLAPTAGGPAAHLAQRLVEVLALPPDPRREAVEGVAVGRALATLMALAVEGAFDSVDALAVAAHRLEGEALARVGADGRARSLRPLLEQRRRAQALRAALGVLRDGLGMLLREPPPGSGARFGRRLRDVEEHLFQALEAVDAARDGLTAALNLHLSAAQNRVNEVIKTLTVLATVVTPITVISSIYGMNFPIPETRWRYGYLFALGLMAACAGGLYAYFRRRGWI